MRRLLALVLALATVGAIVTPLALAKLKKGQVTAGVYRTAVVPGTEATTGFMYRFHVFKPDKEGHKLGGKTFHFQRFAFLKWLKEDKVPADGVVHFCGMGGAPFISPPGLPNGAPAGLLEYQGRSGVYPVDAKSGKPLYAGDDDVPQTTFSVKGRFDEKRHRIKLKGTCDGVTRTLTWKLTKRF